ncbi:MAG TPA: SDR family oxidoreductase [Thermomicrobiales bacterium]|nr:SDR family oxidoreductase [Thermomicrobiales bacterium]
MAGVQQGASELDLSGRTALVTGSGRNIGRAIVLALAGRGANVVVNVRSNTAEGEAVVKAARALGSPAALLVVGDAADPETIQTFRATIEREFGSLDIYVSNAARRLHKTFDETTDEDWHRHLNMQLTASWYLSKAFVPGMRSKQWGRVIHILGPDGWFGGHTRLPHSAAKGALHTFTKGLAWELGADGITVNNVVPGFTRTVRDPATHPQIDAAYTERALEHIPIRRQVEPDEVAWACEFLCAERSGGITGASVHVDGGQYVLS